MKNNERGVALIATLCLIITAGMLAAAIAIISQTTTISIASSSDIIRSRYIAEGASNRILFMIEADRNVYGTTNTTNTETDYAEYDHDRYLPDGVEHEIDYYGIPVRFRVFNGQAGLPMAGNTYTTSLNMLLPTLNPPDKLRENVENLAARIGDYVDNDDNIQTNGMERGDYEALQMINLPRNAALQFREELLWIPGATDILPLDRYGRLTSVRLIDAGTQNTIDLYTAGYTLLLNRGRLEENQAIQLYNARETWRRDRLLIADQIDELVFGQLQTTFSRQPSNYYTILIENANEENRPSAKLAVTFTASGVSGPADGILRYLEWMNF